MARKRGVLWTSGTFSFFVPYVVLYMLASLCLSAIFNNQAIMMPSWFRQWYLLRSSHRRWNWLTGWLQPGCCVLHFKKGQSGYNPITLLSRDWDVKLYPFLQVLVCFSSSIRGGNSESLVVTKSPLRFIEKLHAFILYYRWRLLALLSIIN